MISSIACIRRVVIGTHKVAIIRISEVAMTLGISVKQAHRWAARDGFPAPINTHPCRLWHSEDVILWAEDQGYRDPVTGTLYRIRRCSHCVFREAQ